MAPVISRVNITVLPKGTTLRADSSATSETMTTGQEGGGSSEKDSQPGGAEAPSANISGYARTREYVIADEFRDARAATDPETAFAELLRGKERLLRLNLFEDVQMGLKQAADESVEVDVTVVEKNWWKLRTGASASPHNASGAADVVFSAEGLLRSPSGHGEMISASFEHGARGSGEGGESGGGGGGGPGDVGLGQFTRFGRLPDGGDGTRTLCVRKPRVLGYPFEVALEVRETREDHRFHSSYTERARGGSLTARSHDGTHTLSLGVARRAIGSDASPRDARGESPSPPFRPSEAIALESSLLDSVKSAFRYRWVSDARDNPLTPSQGQRAEATFEVRGRRRRSRARAPKTRGSKARLRRCVWLRLSRAQSSPAARSAATSRRSRASSRCSTT